MKHSRFTMNSLRWRWQIKRKKKFKRRLSGLHSSLTFTVTLLSSCIFFYCCWKICFRFQAFNLEFEWYLILFIDFLTLVSFESDPFRNQKLELNTYLVGNVFCFWDVFIWNIHFAQQKQLILFLICLKFKLRSKF